MFIRTISQTLLKTVQSFPITLLTGPRQSGKTTLLKHLFPNYHYVNLEAPNTLLRIKEDTMGFLKQYIPGCIIDEAQNYPELFSYLQAFIDEHNQPGAVILSGSQNFLLAQKTSQSLAGRAAILELLPLSYNEFNSHKKLSPLTLWEWLQKGSYPRPYHEQLDHTLWYDSYLRTYLERDVRSLTNVHDLSKFQLFLKLCAGRHGHLLNLTELGNDCGISQTTATHWLSILEASYVVFRLMPYYRNFNKRLVKTPKLYFYDSGLVCHLLGLNSSDYLQAHAARGAIFEGFVIAEFAKFFHSQGRRPSNYFWRDHSGHEIDLLMELGNKLKAIEIKSSSTFQPDMVKILLQWDKIAKGQITEKGLVYSGKDSFNFSGVAVTSWQEIKKLSDAN